MNAPAYVTINRKTAEILSDAAHSEVCELLHLAGELAEMRTAILADAAEIDAARVLIDGALGRVS